MRLWSMMMVVAGVLCSLDALAGVVTNCLACGGGARDASCYEGEGVMVYNDALDEKIEYDVTMKLTALADGRDLFEYSYVVAGRVTSQSIILEGGSDAIQGILVPASEGRRGDLASYVETGWGLEREYDKLQQEEGTAKKRTVLLNYLDTNGNRVSHHILLRHRASDGVLVLDSTGTVGSDRDGAIFAWEDTLEQMTACSSAG